MQNDSSIVCAGLEDSHAQRLNNGNCLFADLL